MKAQQRAVKTYRKRLSRKGMARFEVLGLDGDRDLIRDIARRLAGGGPDAVRLRAALENDEQTGPSGEFKLRNGIPLLPVRNPGVKVTMEMVNALRDDDP